MMKLALTINAWLDEELMYAQQLGAEQAVAQAGPAGPALENWGIPRLAALRNRVEKSGFELLGLDYPQAPIIQAEQGEPELLQEIDRFCQLIENAGAAGIGLIAYRWENPWQHLDRLAGFLEAVVPAAEKNHLHLAGSFYPGPYSIVWDDQTYQQLLNLLPSPSHGLDLNSALPGGQNGAVPIQTLLHPGFCERVFLLTLDRSAAELVVDPLLGAKSPVPAELFTMMEILAKAGNIASVRPGRPAGIPESMDIEYQEQAYASGILRALLQSLEHKG